MRCPVRKSALTTEIQPECSWLGGRDLTEPEVVLTSYPTRFSFTEEDPATSTPGLRAPQIGALHAVLAHWTTGRTNAVNVVMPTGTGKTETMVSLLVASRLRCLLVIVPSDALRTQIAGKFETLGILHGFELLPGNAKCPVVGQLRHGFATAESAREFVKACNVLVATPQSLNACDPTARRALIEGCSHLFVDEAHHVAATTWTAIRDEFEGKPVVQFTATPYREDGRHLGGRLLYDFPLREAQRQGYFSRIRYVSVLNLAEPDRAIADRAVAQLREDIEAGLDHLLMARVERIGRAQELIGLYQELAPEFAPVVLHTSVGTRARSQAIAAIQSRSSRIIICVDMLGEGFDLPALKVAAIHDPHKSLGVTLQFIGRFARVSGSTIGEATAVVGRPESDYDPRLRRLYAENTDWNLVIQDLSEAAVGIQQEVTEFEAAFNNLPDDVTLRNLVPKMSTVVYRTRCEDWNPDEILSIYAEDDLLTYPIPINSRDHVIWFVTKDVEAVRWGDLQTVEQVTYELYVLYWDQQRQLLYINCSNNDGVFEALAKAVGGPEVEIIKGEHVYRVMAQLTRLVPTNIGVLDVRNRSRRFSMHVGADVTEGFPVAEAQTKTQAFIFANGYENGIRVGVGASIKGRVWCHQVAQTIKHWVDWCDHVGGKLTNQAISVDEVMRGFIRPEIVEARPPFVALGLEWPWQVYLSLTEELKLEYQGRIWPLIDSDLRVAGTARTGDIPFQIETPNWTADYKIRFLDTGISYEPVGAAVNVVTRRGRDSVPLSQFLTKHGLTVLFENDVTVVAPGVLLRPQRDIPPFERSLLHTIDWSGVNLRKESQGAERAPDSIQGRMLKEVLDDAAWDVVLDDDGSGEVADIVAMRVDGDDLLVTLVHCKFSAQDAAGARVEDLYEVCGQAQKSVRWRRDTTLMFQQLIRRERRRLERGARTGIEVGSAERLYEIQEQAALLKPRFTIAVAQPGLSEARASDAQLHLLACTQVYLYETASSDFAVYCNS